MAKKKEPEDVVTKYRKYALMIMVVLPSLWGGGKLTDKIFFEEYRYINRVRDSIMISNIVRLGDKQDTTNFILKQLLEGKDGQ